MKSVTKPLCANGRASRHTSEARRGDEALKHYWKYLVLAIVAIVATVPIVLYGRAGAPSQAVLPEIVWIIAVAAIGGFLASREPRDYRYELARAVRRYPFGAHLSSIADSYGEILDKERYFAAPDIPDVVSRAYALLKKQAESNAASAVEFASQYPANIPMESTYMDELRDQTARLAALQQQLVERTVRIRSIKDDVDTSSVDDIIQALDEVLGNRELATAPLRSKYEEAGENDG